MRSPTQTHSPDSEPTSFCFYVLVLRVQRRQANTNCIFCLDELPHSLSFTPRIDVTEITSRSDIECACECKRNTLCHRASYDRLTKRCRIFNEHIGRNCDVGLDVIQTSVFLKKVDGKLCNFDRFPLVILS
jgi:hypothetical protein